MMTVLGQLDTSDYLTETATEPFSYNNHLKQTMATVWLQFRKYVWSACEEGFNFLYVCPCTSADTSD